MISASKFLVYKNFNTIDFINSINYFINSIIYYLTYFFYIILSDILLFYRKKKNIEIFQQIQD